MTTTEAAPVAAVTVRPRGATARLVTPMPDDRLWGWLGPIAVAVLAGLLRFDRLGVPGNYVFDEVYYGKDAAKLLRYGVEWNAAKGTPDFVVHPHAGKWLIAFGEWVFGNDAFGRRFALAVAGTLSVLMLARIARRLFRSTLLGCAAGLLLALDGMHYVLSRTALLDLLVMFWVLAAFGALLVDRDHTRARLASYLSTRGLPRRLGPGLGLRPWRLAAGVFLGLACATKWNGLFFLAGFGLLSVLWDVGARKSAGVRYPTLAVLVRDAAPAFASLVLVALVVYVGTWAGWFAGGAKGWDRYYAREHPGPALLPDALWSLWHYHQEMYNFHKGLHDFHPYKSNPWSWLVLGRPVSFFYEGPTQGQRGCEVAQCSQAVTALGSPAVWWAAVLALPVVGWLWAGRRDWRAGAILAGVAAGYLPWFAYQSRTIYSFYAVAFLPFLVLAVTMCLGLLLGPRTAGPLRRVAGSAVVGCYLLVVVYAFWRLAPVLSAEVIPYAEWLERMDLRSWI